MRKNRLLLLFLLASFLLSACGQAQERSLPYRIYLISKSTSTEFWRSVFAGANAARAEYNVELTICGPETEEDYLGQNRYIEEAIENHADAIVFSAISYTENAPAIDAAAEAGIKIVVIDSDVNSSRVSACLKRRISRNSIFVILPFSLDRFMYEHIYQAANRCAERVQEQIVNVRSSFKEGKLEDLNT